MASILSFISFILSFKACVATARALDREVLTKRLEGILSDTQKDSNKFLF